jgi:hypothetical protein
MVVPHRKHITSPLLTQQFNAIYSFVTKLYQYNCHNSGHYLSSCILLKTTFQRLDPVTGFRRNLLSWAQKTGLISVSGNTVKVI